MSSTYKITTNTPSVVTNTANDHAHEAAKTKKIPAVSLFDNSQYATSTASTDAVSAAGLTLPEMTPDQMQAHDALYAGLSDSDKEKITAASNNLGAAMIAVANQTPAAATPSDAASIKAVGSVGTGGIKAASISQASPDTTNTLSNAVGTAQSTLASVKPYNDPLSSTLSMGISGYQNQMTQAAQAMQNNTNQLNALNTSASELNGDVKDWPDDGSTKSITYLKIDDKGGVTEVTENLTKDQASKAADACTNAASTISSQSAIQQIQLQQVAQNYSNAVSMLSNMLKVQADTLKNTVGNLH